MLLSQIIKHTDYDDTQFTDTEREAVEGLAKLVNGKFGE